MQTRTFEFETRGIAIIFLDLTGFKNLSGLIKSGFNPSFGVKKS
jgi:hypothetical protein